VWVAAGGRGTLVGAVLGAIGVNWIQSWLTTSYPDLWLIFLGALFMGVVLFFPDGALGAFQRASQRLGTLLRRRGPGPTMTPAAAPVDSPPIQSIGEKNVSRPAPRTGHPRSEPASPTPLQKT
jgi:hypothetical protein